MGSTRGRDGSRLVGGFPALACSLRVNLVLGFLAGCTWMKISVLEFTAFSCTVCSAVRDEEQMYSIERWQLDRGVIHTVSLFLLHAQSVADLYVCDSPTSITPAEILVPCARPRSCNNRPLYVCPAPDLFLVLETVPTVETLFQAVLHMPQAFANARKSAAFHADPFVRCAREVNFWVTPLFSPN